MAEHVSIETVTLLDLEARGFDFEDIVNLDVPGSRIGPARISAPVYRFEGHKYVPVSAFRDESAAQDKARETANAKLIVSSHLFRVGRVFKVYTIEK